MCFSMTGEISLFLLGGVEVEISSFCVCSRKNYGIMCKDIFFLLFRWFCIMVEDLVAWLTIDIASKPQLNSPIGLGASVFLFNIL